MTVTMQPLCSEEILALPGNHYVEKIHWKVDHLGALSISLRVEILIRVISIIPVCRLTFSENDHATIFGIECYKFQLFLKSTN